MRVAAREANGLGPAVANSLADAGGDNAPTSTTASAQTSASRLAVLAVQQRRFGHITLAENFFCFFTVFPSFFKVLFCFFAFLP